MAKLLSFCIAVMLAATAVPAAAQQAVEIDFAQPISGTRLDVSATGAVTRVPDIAVISAGVVTRAATASQALQQNSTRMERVLAALRSAGVADRDIQTSSINLNPEYRYQDGQAPQLTGYTATNSVTIRFRDIRNSGSILDALVAQGANQINGPSMTIDKPEAALDEARSRAIAAGLARAQLYASALGKRVGRVLSINESGGYSPPQPMPYAAMARAQSADTKIEPGEQKLEISVAMAFELL
ncbi:SIMPL domain-containing protein [Sphingomonas sabuli]|uniref:SIMPL domain-containing protein n=1 Tax=Sphingomonas sabuli TaxID=2764186 RepID=A0A7G9KZZ7_9SPHN|nr:SIMPL domain-containing protein [Sphingomonas sabuli]QNM81946.1 SIMPL domain-containing protein [Sphingomonas sabuli]